MPWVSSFLKYEWPKVKLSRLLPLNLFLILVANRPAIENMRSESVELAGIDSKAIIAQFRAIKWRKRKQALRAIARNGIAIGNPSHD